MIVRRMAAAALASLALCSGPSCAWAHDDRAAGASATLTVDPSGLEPPVTFALDGARHVESLGPVGGSAFELRLEQRAARVRVRQYVALAKSNDGPWRDVLAPLAATGWTSVACSAGRCTMPADFEDLPTPQRRGAAAVAGSIDALRAKRLRLVSPKARAALAACGDARKMDGYSCYIYNSRMDIEVRAAGRTTQLVLGRAGGC